jgi:hypothetical protein
MEVHPLESIQVRLAKGEEYTVIYEMTYDHCGEYWTRFCTCRCDDLCPKCRDRVTPVKSIVARKFRDYDLKIDAPHSTTS